MKNYTCIYSTYHKHTIQSNKCGLLEAGLTLHNLEVPVLVLFMSLTSAPHARQALWHPI